MVAGAKDACMEGGGGSSVVKIIVPSARTGEKIKEVSTQWATTPCILLHRTF